MRRGSAGRRDGMLELLARDALAAPPEREAGVDEFGGPEAQREIVGLGLEIADAMLAAGYETRIVQLSVTACLHRFGLPGVRVDVDGRIIVIELPRRDAAEVSMTRAATSIGSWDLERMTIVDRLLRGVLSGRVDRHETIRVLRRPPAAVWDRWPVVLTGGCVLAASIAFQTYGDWASIPAAMVLLVVVVLIGRGLAAWALPGFYRTLVQAGVAVGLAATAVHLGWLGEVPAISAAAAAILLILPIPAIVSFAEDVVTGFPGTAADRAVTVLAAFAAAACGAVLASAVIRDLVLDDTWVKVATYPLPAFGAVVAAIVGALGNALYNNGPWRLLWPAAIAGLVAGVINLAGQRELGLAPMVAVSAAAVALGVVSALLAGPARVPAPAIVLTGVTGALLPGLDVVRGLTLELAGDAGGFAALVSALATTALIGIGVVFGVWIVTRLARIRGRDRGRSRGGVGARA